MTASEDAPIIRLANSILGLAIKQGASDIHVEPMEHDVDGPLPHRRRPAGGAEAAEEGAARADLAAEDSQPLDIAEKRLPQDGRISVTMDGKPIDFRVSTVPGKWGEKVVPAHPRQVEHDASASTG